MFFAVKQPIKIAGKVFQPCICYKLTPLFELNIAKLVAEGRATMYEKEVFFQNGKIIENKKVEVEAKPVAEQPVVQEEQPVQEKPKTKKKSKKETEEETF